MHPDKKAYRISVAAPDGRARLICVSYPLDSSATNYGMDFYELVWSTTLPAQSIPSSRQATFKEELRCMHRASRSYVAGHESEEEFIAIRMRDVYGNDASIALSPIDELMQSTDL